MPTRRYTKRYRKRAPPIKKVRTIVRRELRNQTWNELSYLDTQGFNRNLGYDSAFIQHITGVPVGTAAGDRTGNKILIHELHFKAQFYKPLEGVVNAPGIVRCALVRINTDAGPSVSRLYAALGTSQTDVTAFRNPALLHDFTILKQWDLDLGINNTTQYNSRNTVYVKYNKKFKKPIKAQYSGGLSTDISNGQLYIVAYSNYIAASTGPKLNQWHTRVIYSQ